MCGFKNRTNDKLFYISLSNASSADIMVSVDEIDQLICIEITSLTLILSVGFDTADVVVDLDIEDDVAVEDIAWVPRRKITLVE